MNINGYTLDESQIKAIECENNTLVSACAGSGKTLTILGKVKYLIDKGYKDEEILCISFTNETVNSLKQKLNNMNINVDVYTFHKLSLNIIGNTYKIAEIDYLDFIIEEYFLSYIKYNKKKLNQLKRLLYNNINNIFNNKEYLELKKLISTFIKLFKSNNYPMSYLYKIYKKSIFKERIILKYILDISLIYKRELESSNKIDFDDMISLATKEVQNKKLKYKYIIIDEFQDTSLVRFNLIKEIIKYTDSKLFVVGDDWQSIYRFSGCDINLFINFNKYFKDASYFYLKNTYRNCRELAYVSSTFVKKNKRQLDKVICSNKSITKPIKIVYGYKTDELINIISGDDILILGRNNFDIANVNWPNKLTIHKSKGLEANIVVLINSDNIPNKRKNDYLLRHVLNEKDVIPFEEERRLFYVALTRTKSYIYIMVNKKNSLFVKELIKDYKEYIEIIKKDKQCCLPS